MGTVRRKETMKGFRQGENRLVSSHVGMIKAVTYNAVTSDTTPS